MKHIIALLIVFLSITTSCLDYEMEPNIKDINQAGITIIPRPKDNPWIPFVYKGYKSTRANIPSLTMNDFLGYSFVYNSYPLENTSNLGYRVIDLTEYLRIYPNRIQKWKNLSQDVNKFSFSNFEDFNSKSSFTNKINKGEDLNFLCFHFGHKHTYSKTFGEDLISNSNTTFGALNISYKDSVYRMEYSEPIRKEILKKCLSTEFIQDLHYMKPYDFFQKYGSVVTCSYFSGGRATALYAGIHKENSSTDNVANDMTAEIEASFNFTKDSNTSKLAFGRGGSSSSTISITNKFESIKMAVKTLGGNASSASFSTAQNVNNLNIDLSSWLSSLNNPNLHVISEFTDKGLIPISDFIFETNLKKEFESYINGSKNNTDREPYISIRIIPGGEYYVVTSQFYYKHGGPLWLSIIQFSGNGIAKDFNHWLKRQRYIFNIKTEIIGPPFPDIEVDDYDEPNSKLIGGSATDFTYTKIIEKDIIYLIAEKEKCGFSIPNNLQYINEYGMSNFISNTKFSTLTYSDLIDQDYNIIAL